VKGEKEGKPKTHSVWTISRSNTAAIKQKAHRRWCLALSLAECVHQFLKGRGSLDLEEHLVVVIRDLDVQMFRLSSAFWLLLCSRASVLIVGGHFEWCRVQIYGDQGFVKLPISRVRPCVFKGSHKPFLELTEIYLSVENMEKDSLE
jgi:hypothetical protein